MSDIEVTPASGIRKRHCSLNRIKHDLRLIYKQYNFRDAVLVYEVSMNFVCIELCPYSLCCCCLWSIIIHAGTRSLARTAQLHALRGKIMQNFEAGALKCCRYTEYLFIRKGRPSLMLLKTKQLRLQGVASHISSSFQCWVLSDWNSYQFSLILQVSFCPIFFSLINRFSNTMST